MVFKVDGNFEKFPALKNRSLCCNV